MMSMLMRISARMLMLVVDVHIDVDVDSGVSGDGDDVRRQQCYWRLFVIGMLTGDGDADVHGV